VPPPPGPPPAPRYSEAQLLADNDRTPLPIAGGGGLLSDAEKAGEACNGFYMCAKCGFYASGALWREARLTRKNKQVWYCNLDWLAFRTTFPEQYAQIMRVCVTEERADSVIGCGIRYVPWARGPAMCLEFKRASRRDEWGCLMAELTPPPIQQMLNKVKALFYSTLEGITADELRAAIPMVLPKLNPFPIADMANVPGVGKLDIEAYRAAGNPVMTNYGWWRFVRAVAERNMSALKPVFDRATALLNELNQPLEEEGPAEGTEEMAAVAEGSDPDWSE
jgi:hypothetical protein